MKIAHWVVAVIMMSAITTGIVLFLAGWAVGPGLSFPGYESYNYTELNSLTNQLQNETIGANIDEASPFETASTSALITTKLTWQSLGFVTSALTAGIADLGIHPAFYAFAFALLIVLFVFAIMNAFQRWEI